MIVKPGDTIYIEGFFRDSTTGAGKTGLTVAAYLRDQAGNDLVDNQAASAVNASKLPGWYSYPYTIPSNAVNGPLRGRLNSTGSGIDAQDQPSYWVINSTNVGMISGDATAADNLEAGYDGAGYAGGTIKQQVSVAGYESGQAPLQPTVAGRTLDVSTGGESGIDLANVGSPTTTLNLSGTTIKTATDVETDTQDMQSRLPNVLVGGRIKADAQAIGGSTAAADAIASDGGTWITTIATMWAYVQTIAASIVAALSGNALTVVSQTEETAEGTYITIHQGHAGSVTLTSTDERTLTTATVFVDVAGQTLDTTVTGSAGDWTIVIPYTADESTEMKKGAHDYEINLLSGGVAQDPPIAYLAGGWIVKRNIPGG